MKAALAHHFLQLACTLFAFLAMNASGAVRYVDVNSANPTPPYTNWATAATNIQDAVDVAGVGDQVLVTNGVYQTGGRIAPDFDGTTNRVVVDKAVSIQSVSGPQVTIIDGSGLVRCVYLTNGASLSGFSLTNGATTGSGGGVLGASKSASVSNCVLSGNSAGTGGGAYGVTLSRCIIAGNSATRGGGVAGAALTACTVVSNSAVLHGGGVYGQVLRSTALTNCTLIGNSALYGGGAYGVNSGNYCTLVNCTVVGNSAPGDLNAATGDHGGGGAHSSRLINSIVYYNQGRGLPNDNVRGCTIQYSCTTDGRPPETVGQWSTTNAPLFVDTNGWANLRLQSNSPCINAGNNDYVTSPVDLAGWERIVGGTVDMGAYEWVAVPTHYVSLTSPNPTPPYLSWSTAATNIQDAVDAAVAGEEIVVTNGLYTTGGRAVYGTMTNRVVIDKAVTVRSVNGPQVTIIVGRAVGITTNGNGAIRCVYVGTNAVLSGFTLTNGHTRSGHPNKEGSGGGAWCEISGVISNCILSGNSAIFSGGGAYAGTLNNCILTGNSADGDTPTGFYGYGGGAYAATLNNCTLSGNSAFNSGGGAHGGALNSCIVVSNSAEFGGGVVYAVVSNSRLGANSVGIGGDGGGAVQSTLVNCTLAENRAGRNGGGADSSTLNNCILYRNSAYRGGGASRSTLNNCTIYFNDAYIGGGTYFGNVNNSIFYWNYIFSDATNGPNYLDSTLNYSCATPLAPGSGNITNETLFLCTCSPSPDLRLQSNSPCINAGNNAYAPSGPDLDGNPRIGGGTVDMGAYEFQAPSSVLSYAWAQQYGLPTDGSADYSDSDSDLMNNWQEWIAGTVPTNAVSVLQLLNPTNDVSGVTLSWQSVSNRTYFLERATNLGAQPPFSLLASNIIGQAGTTSYTDTNAVGTSPFFYRVAVQE